MTCHHGPSLKLSGSGGRLGLGANMVKQSHDSHHWGAGSKVGLGATHDLASRPVPLQILVKQL
jgi:hypothetical protein